jgi:hypothetical protein
MARVSPGSFCNAWACRSTSRVGGRSPNTASKTRIEEVLSEKQGHVYGTRDQEAERLLALGASEVGDFRRPDGRGWVTLTDPEGNEFCVLPPDQATSNPIS